MNALISGVAGDIGVGVSRILRKWGVFKELYGIDINSDHYASHFLDGCSECPRADDESYFSWVETYIKKNNCDLFIPTSEAELGVLAQNGISQIGRAKVLINAKSIVQTCLDKYLCFNYLHNNGIAIPKFGLLEDDIPISFPAIVKPRMGQGSKNVSVVTSSKDVAKSYGKNMLWQSYLYPDDEEYTCAVYVSNTGVVHTMIMKRKLLGGLTVSGEVVRSRSIDEYIRAITSVLKPIGSINIQLRLTDEGPRLFEINPRLSSTLVFRDLLGFQDLRWWVSDLLGLRVKFEISAPEENTRFFRGAKEFIMAKPNEGK